MYKVLENYCCGMTGWLAGGLLPWYGFAVPAPSTGRPGVTPGVKPGVLVAPGVVTGVVLGTAPGTAPGTALGSVVVGMPGVTGTVGVVAAGCVVGAVHAGAVVAGVVPGVVVDVGVVESNVGGGAPFIMKKPITARQTRTSMTVII